MWEIIQGAGWFIWPLGACSVAALFIAVERLIGLRRGLVLPRELERNFLTGAPPTSHGSSTAGRILHFFHEARPDAEQLKAFARLEISRLERGLHILDFIISAAPLLGLLGTVAGLVSAFAGVNSDSGIADRGDLARGISMALSTTMIGLVIAIPAMAAASFLYRQVDLLAAQLEVLLEHLLAQDRGPATEPPALPPGFPTPPRS